MQYHFRNGVTIEKRRGKPFFIATATAIALVGVYALITAFSPMLVGVPFIGDTGSMERRLKAMPDTNGSRLYIPKINVDVPIIEGDKAALESGAWHRKPENGNPETGGNFILSANRFSMGLTPGQTRVQSPFYNIGTLQPGDQLFIDYKGERYGYKVIKKDSVAPDQLGFEARSDVPKLTLYSYVSIDDTSDREVIVAEPLGKVKDLNIRKN